MNDALLGLPSAAHGGVLATGSLRRLPIARVAEHFAGAVDVAALDVWIAALQADGRRGCLALAERGRRRRDALAREAARLEALFERRRLLRAQGCRHVAGVDEVGVGPLAGPVVAAAVALPDDASLPGLDDSKKLTAKERERLDESIRRQCLGFAVAEVEPGEIDRTNVLRASLEAMRRAVVALAAKLPLDHLMVDARSIPAVAIPQTPLVHGDALDASIAAASIVAKVHRDARMRELDRVHPGYGFARHMGYGTAEHLAALRRLGASPIHRRSFAPVASVLGGAALG